MNLTTRQLQGMGYSVFGGKAIRNIRVPVVGKDVKVVANKVRTLPFGYDSQWEVDYADHLRLLTHSGSVVFWQHHPFAIRLDDETTWKPDFLVQLADKSIEIHEIKGYERRDARIRFRWAAQRLPCFRYVMLRKVSGSWEIMRDIESANPLQSNAAAF